MQLLHCELQKKLMRNWKIWFVWKQKIEYWRTRNCQQFDESQLKQCLSELCIGINPIKSPHKLKLALYLPEKILIRFKKWMEFNGNTKNSQEFMDKFFNFQQIPLTCTLNDFLYKSKKNGWVMFVCATAKETIFTSFQFWQNGETIHLDNARCRYSHIIRAVLNG